MLLEQTENSTGGAKYGFPLWFRAFGAPSEIYTDPDSAFLSQEFTDWLQSFRTSLGTTAGQASWQKGRVERGVATLEEHLLCSWETCDAQTTPRELGWMDGRPSDN